MADKRWSIYLPTATLAKSTLGKPGVIPKISASTPEQDAEFKEWSNELFEDLQDSIDNDSKAKVKFVALEAISNHKVLKLPEGLQSALKLHGS